jgi:hypothetical protein
VRLIKAYSLATTQKLGILTREHATIGAVHLLWHILDVNAIPSGYVELRSAYLFVGIFVSQIATQRFQTLAIVAVHRVVVAYFLAVKVNAGQSPVEAQVNGRQDEIVREQVDFFGPATDGRVAVLDQFRVEEGRESVDFYFVVVVVLCAPLDDEIHVKVDYFVVEPIEAFERLYVATSYFNVEACD